MKADMWEWSRWKHPRTTQLLEHLIAVDFADRFDALCRAHPVAGPAVPFDMQAGAVASLSREIYWSRVTHRFTWREAWRPRSRLPEFTAIGLDIHIDSRVELELVFATPEGHLSGPFPRFSRQLRQMRDPDYEHDDPAPCIAMPDDLPRILEQGMLLYDDLARSLVGDSWWELAPKPWIVASPVEDIRLAA